MRAPTYEIGDTVYLRESAAIGFLEAVRISGITMYNGSWVYNIGSRPNLPVGNATYGDKFSLTDRSLMYFEESEFISLCSGLNMMKNYHQLKLNEINTKLESLCNQ